MHLWLISVNGILDAAMSELTRGTYVCEIFPYSVLPLGHMFQVCPAFWLNIPLTHSLTHSPLSSYIIVSYFRIVKEAGISVTDASAAWYLQILASTALATMTVAPHLKASIIQLTK